MSVGFLSAGTAGAATDPSLTGLPEWAVFERSGDPAFGRSYENHRDEVRALKAAYDAWIADPANAAHAGAGLRAAVGGSKKAAAAAVMADADTVGRLAKSHKAALIGAMAGHDTTAGTHATADEVVGNARVLGHLGEHHKPALIGAMSAHSAPDTATAVIDHSTDGGTTYPLRGEVINSIAAGHHVEMIAKLAADGRHADMRTAVINDAPSRAATAAAIVGNADLKRELATTHRGAMLTEMTHDAGAVTATAVEVERNADLKRKLATTHRSAMLTEMTHDPAAVTATVAEIVANDALLTAVVKRWIKGANPGDNGGKGNGFWHDLTTAFNREGQEAIQSVFGDVARVGGQKLFPEDALLEGSIAL